MPKIRHYQGLPLEIINHSDLLDMPDIGGINSDHDSRYYTQAQLGSIVAPSGASLIGVSDAGAFFAGADVEAVLQELLAVILPADYLRLDGTNVPTANYNWVTNLTTTGTLQGGTITDGVAALTGGAWTGATYNGLTITTGVNTFTLTRGATDLIVNADCTINQNLSSTSSPTFNALTVTSINGLTGIGCAGNVISITCGTTDLTVSADCAINQNLNTLASPSFVTVTGTTSVVANTMTMATGSIIDTTGTISFGNEILTTTGSIGLSIATPGSFFHAYMSNNLLTKENFLILEQDGIGDIGFSMYLTGGTTWSMGIDNTNDDLVWSNIDIDGANILGFKSMSLSTVSDLSLNLRGFTSGGRLLQYSKVNTNTIFNIFIASLDKGGANPTAGFGLGYLFILENGAGVRHDAGHFSFEWTDSTATSEDVKFILQTMSAGAFVDSITCEGPQVKFQDGTNLLPSVTNLGDPNTGLFWSSADILNITAGGTEIAEFDTTSINFTVDLLLEADELRFTNAGTNYIRNTSSDQDLYCTANDGGAVKTAWWVDASDNAKLKVPYLDITTALYAAGSIGLTVTLCLEPCQVVPPYKSPLKLKWRIKDPDTPNMVCDENCCELEFSKGILTGISGECGEPP